LIRPFTTPETDHDQSPGCWDGEITRRERGLCRRDLPAFSASPKPVISEEASAAMMQMGQTLLAKQFSFQARTLRVYADTDGRFLRVGDELKVLVRRPDRLRADVDGDDGVHQLFYDGKTLVLYSPANKEYLSIPVPDMIEGRSKRRRSALASTFPWRLLPLSPCY
jgi:hypothetical protein